MDTVLSGCLPGFVFKERYLFYCQNASKITVFSVFLAANAAHFKSMGNIVKNCGVKWNPTRVRGALEALIAGRLAEGKECFLHDYRDGEKRGWLWTTTVSPTGKYKVDRTVRVEPERF